MLSLFRNILKPAVTFAGQQLMIGAIKSHYLAHYPLDRCLRKEMIGAISPAARLKSLNSIRTNIIQSTFWSNAGAVFALIVALLSSVFSVVLYFLPLNGEVWPWLLRPIPNFPHKELVTGTVFFLFVATLLYLITVSVVALLLKRITQSLPARQYAELSLSNLDQSEMLTFVAYKMWQLCHKFETAVPIPDLYTKLASSEMPRLARLYVEQDTNVKNATQTLQQQIRKFKSEYYSDLNRCTELKLQVIEKLAILPREFCHHILKFSTHMFEVRVNKVESDIDAILDLVRSDKADSDEYLIMTRGYISDLIGIFDDIKRRRKRALLQLILFDDIHEYVIGIASETSTSQSLKVFTRGLSALFGQLRGGGDETEGGTLGRVQAFPARTVAAVFASFASLFDLSADRAMASRQDKVLEKIRSFLHRSKAHFGMDLLISLENFYIQSNIARDSEMRIIPKLLYAIKYKKEIGENIYEYSCLLRGIRSHFLHENERVVKCLKEGFATNLKAARLDKVKGNRYFFVFGYSKMVLSVLKSCSVQLWDLNCKILVIKEDDEIMLDTRMFRFELHETPGGFSELNTDESVRGLRSNTRPDSIRESLTASDDFLFTSIQEHDKIIMLAGAEAFFSDTSRLLHTNRYQSRIERFIERLEKSNKKPNPEVWIVAGRYKIYANFFKDFSDFGREFFSDHYDKVDFYDFSRLKKKGRLKLITG